MQKLCVTEKIEFSMGAPHPMLDQSISSWVQIHFPWREDILAREFFETV